MADVIIQIPAELFATAESSHFDGKVQLDEIVLGPDTYRFANPVTWNIDITNTGNAFLVMGQAEGDAVVDCSRCLEPVDLHLVGEIEGYYLTSSQDSAAFDDEDDDAPGEDEFEILPDDHRIDIMPLIRAALMVEMPVMPLCQDDCAGLCPTCGANLNEGVCDCGEDEALADFAQASNPFAKLSEYKFTNN